MQKLAYSSIKNIMTATMLAAIGAASIVQPTLANKVIVSVGNRHTEGNTTGVASLIVVDAGARYAVTTHLHVSRDARSGVSKGYFSAFCIDANDPPVLNLGTV